MLPLSIRTSHSNMDPINDFHYLYELGRCSKCSMFVLFNGTLYGFPNDCCCVHEIPVPFQTNSDLIFRLDTVDKEVLAKYQNFFIPAKFDWIILPDYYWNMYINGDLIAEYSQEMNQMVILDKTTRLPIEQFFTGKTRIQDDKIRLIMLDQLEAFLQRQIYLSPVPEIFIDMQSHPVIRSIFDNKASGTRLVRLTNPRVDVMFQLYKSLFTLNKSDELSIMIRPDVLQTNTFMATFIPIKKKNPMKLNTYGVPFSEKVHAMYVNIAS